MGRSDDVEFLLASVRQEIDALKADRRLRKPSDGNRGKAFYQHVLDLIGVAEFLLEQDSSSNAPPETQEAFGRVLRALMLNLRSAHEAMPWLAASRSPQINLGSLYLVEEFAEILVGKSVDLVVVPDPEYMYSAQSWPFREFIRHIEGFEQKTKRRPVVLRYPLSDDNRLLLHAGFAHELSHPSVQEHNLVERVCRQVEAATGFEAELQETAEAVFPASTPAQTAETLRGWLQSWLEELLCDHLAADLIGPAYLWAFAGFLMPVNYERVSTTHPPATVRVRLLLELLTERGWGDYLRRTPGLTIWLERIAADANNELSPPYPFLRDQVLRHGGLLRNVAEEVVDEESRLTPESAVPEADQVEELLGRLLLPVRPNGVLDEVLEPRAILLGGWQRALASGDGTPSSLIAAFADQQLQDLVGKAIELSVVTSCWEER